MPHRRSDNRLYRAVGCMSLFFKSKVSTLQPAVWLSVEEAFVVRFDWQVDSRRKATALKNLIAKYQVGLCRRYLRKQV